MTHFNVTKRETNTTGQIRQARLKGETPAIIYGNKKDPKTVFANTNQIHKIYEKGILFSTKFELDNDGEKIYVIVKDLQLDPITDKILHIDFLEVTNDTLVKINVPLKFINYDKSIGIKRGGTLNIVQRKIALICTAGDIPENILVDIEKKKIGSNIRTNEITFPDNVKIAAKDDNFVIAGISGRNTGGDDENTTTDAE